MDTKYEITCKNIDKLFNMKISEVNRRNGYYDSVEDITVGEFLAKCILHTKFEEETITEEKLNDLLYAINQVKMLEKEKRNTVGQDSRNELIRNLKNMKEYLTKNDVQTKVTVDTIIGRKK